jgi:pimeloyl-ACP methyl ester carboxylesterase
MTAGEVSWSRRRRTVTIHGHELSYLDSGTGSVVLFIHGILGLQRQWTHLIDRLHDDHRVIVPGLFGHGESDKPVARLPEFVGIFRGRAERTRW